MKKIILAVALLAAQARAYNDCNMSALNMFNACDAQEFFSTHLNIEHIDLPEATDNTDPGDQLFCWETCPDEWVPGTPGLYSIAPDGNRLIYDYRHWNSVSDFNVAVFYYGGISIPTTRNYVWIDWYLSYPPRPENPFDNKSVRLYSNSLYYGASVDVRRAIAEANQYHGAKIRLKDLPSGCYTPNNPYAYFTIKIGKPELLCDFNNDRKNNLLDLTIIAADWNKPNGSYCTDLSGPKGNPDGFIDLYDLKELFLSYPKQRFTLGDFNQDGIANLLDYAILANNWLFFDEQCAHFFNDYLL